MISRCRTSSARVNAIAVFLTVAVGCSATALSQEYHASIRQSEAKAGSSLSPSQVVLKYWILSEKRDLVAIRRYVKGKDHKRWEEMAKKQKNREETPTDADLARSDPVEPVLLKDFPRTVFKAQIQLKRVEREKIDSDEAQVTVLVGYKSKSHRWIIDFFLIKDKSEWKIADLNFRAAERQKGLTAADPSSGSRRPVTTATAVKPSILADKTLNVVSCIWQLNQAPIALPRDRTAAMTARAI